MILALVSHRKALIIFIRPSFRVCEPSDSAEYKILFRNKTVTALFIAANELSRAYSKSIIGSIKRVKRVFDSNGCKVFG